MGARVVRSGAVAAAIALTCVGPCLGNPIAVDDAAQAEADRAQAAGLASPGASASHGGLSGDRRTPLAADSDEKLLAKERDDAMASARDPALIPIDTQGVGAQSHPTPSALPKKPEAVAGEDDDALKKLALNARDWMHDMFGKPDNAQDNAPDQALPAGPGGDLGLPVESQASGVAPMSQRAQRPVEVPAPGAGPHRAAAAPVQETAGARLLADSAPEYSIQQALKRCREVLVHPLTWLVIVLIGATRIAMSRGRR